MVLSYLIATVKWSVGIIVFWFECAAINSNFDLRAPDAYLVLNYLITTVKVPFFQKVRIIFQIAKSQTNKKKLFLKNCPELEI